MNQVFNFNSDFGCTFSEAVSKSLKALTLSMSYLRWFVGVLIAGILPASSQFLRVFSETERILQAWGGVTQGESW